MPTGLEILDSAIKIGLGAFIGGVTTYWTAKLNYAREIEKGRIIRRREIFESVSDHCTSFTHALRNYWALMANWCDSHAIAGDKTVKLRIEAEKASKRLYEAFHELTSAEGKLLLLNVPEARSKLRDYGTYAQQFYSEIDVDKNELSEEKVNKFMEEMRKLHDSFMASLSTAYSSREY
jgi:hypothetical protein